MEKQKKLNIDLGLRNQRRRKIKEIKQTKL